jgi:ABC-type sugar transport system ATPase subunit
VTGLLVARGIVKDFPGVRALGGVDFDLQAGEVHALVGENGAGKSTLVNILTGVYQPDDGELNIDGEAVRFNSPRDATEQGICVIHQESAFVPHLDVGTNLCLGDIPIRQAWWSRLVGGVIDRAEVRRRAKDALATIKPPFGPDARVGSLSVAESQLLDIARALSYKFRILLLDEPTSSLSPSEREELFHHLGRLKQSGIGIMYISHHLDEIVRIADRVSVLRDGKMVGRSERSQFSIDHLIELMTGRARQDPVSRRRTYRKMALELRKLTREPAFRNVSFSLRFGELAGLTGLVGSGRTEVAHCIIGADRFDSGEILLEGRPIKPAGQYEATNLGIGYLTENRKEEGIFHLRPLGDNILVGGLVRNEVAKTIINRFQWVRPAAASSLVSTWIHALDIRPPNSRVLAGTLSGGNQQKVVLARWLASKVKILILDEPTRGVAIGAKLEIWRLINKLVDEGIAVLVISSEAAELLANADRIIVMRDGEIAGEVKGESSSEAELMRLAAGKRH